MWASPLDPHSNHPFPPFSFGIERRTKETCHGSSHRRKSTSERNLPWLLFTASPLLGLPPYSTCAIIRRIISSTWKDPLEPKATVSHGSECLCDSSCAYQIHLLASYPWIIGDRFSYDRHGYPRQLLTSLPRVAQFAVLSPTTVPRIVSIVTCDSSSHRQHGQLRQAPHLCVLRSLASFGPAPFRGTLGTPRCLDRPKE